MEGNIFVLFLAIGLAALFVIALLLFTIAEKAPRKPKVTGPPVDSHFERENQVSGTLYVDGKAIPTFNIGRLILDDAVRVTFYSNFNSDVRITDIEMNDTSIFAYAPAGLTYRQKCDYAVQVLQNSANQRLISRDLAAEVEQIILDVDSLNEHIKAGRIVQVPGASEDFAWRG